MKSPGTVAMHLLIMLAYSVAFIAGIGGTPRWTDKVSLVIWLQAGVLVLHIVILLVLGLRSLRHPERREKGKKFLLASLVVAIVGFGMCFFNGLLHVAG